MAKIRPRLKVPKVKPTIKYSDSSVRNLQEVRDEFFFAGELAIESAMAGAFMHSRRHVHGVEDRLAGRFWSSTDDELSEEEEEPVWTSSPTNQAHDNLAMSDIVRSALKAGFTNQELALAAGNIDGKLACEIVMAVADQVHTQHQTKSQVKPQKADNKNTTPLPWQGPLPQPRKSPKNTLEAALLRAKVCPSLVREGWPHRMPVSPRSADHA